jgi:hypothetical protein
MELKDIQAGFTRARRFLIAISLAISLTKMLAIPFTQINILGNVATIPHPEQVGWIFWIAWFWAIYQYLVWLKDAGAWGEFRAAVNDACAKHLGEAAAKIPMPERLRNELKANLFGKLGSAQGISPSADVKFCQRFYSFVGDGKNKPRVANVVADAFIRLADQRGEATAGETRYEVEISEDEWRRRNWDKTIKVLLTSRFIPEYFAPFVIGLLPVGVAFFRHCHPAT